MATNASQLKLQLQQMSSKCCCCCYQGIVHRASLWKSAHIWLISMFIIESYLVLYGLKNWNDLSIATNLTTIVISLFGFPAVILCLFGIHQCDAWYILPFRLYIFINVLVLSVVTLCLYVWEYHVDAYTFTCFIVWFLLCWCLDLHRVYELAKNISNANISLKQIICNTANKIKALCCYLCNCFANTANNSIAAPLNPPNNNNNNVASHVQNTVQLQISNVVWQCFLVQSWQNYDALTSQYIESKFKENSIQMFECSIRNAKYYINFNEMTQSNAQTGKKRQIKRLVTNSNNNSNNANSNTQHVFSGSMDSKRMNDQTDNVASDDHNMQLKLSDEERLELAKARSLSMDNNHHSQPPPQYRPLVPQYVMSESMDNEGCRDVIDTEGAQNVSDNSHKI